MRPLTLKEIAIALDCPAAGEGVVTGVCTDTRRLEPGCLFVALKGEHFDGHSFAQDALALGAAAVLCERDCALGERQLLVANSYRALAQLAAYYRSLFPIPVVAVTGSVGKTTTKEMTACVLGSRFQILKSEKNYNNEIGLPMTLLRLDEHTELAVLEMGMSAFGEIALLSRTARPSLAIISNIGLSHIENLGSQENILKAKLEILEGMPKDAPLLLNGDDAFLRTVKPDAHPVYLYGIENPECRFRARELRSENGQTVFTAQCDKVALQVTLPCVGRHNVYNALAAMAAGVSFGLSPEQCAQALLQYHPSGMRQRIRTVKEITFIEDCYNASPDSLSAALLVLQGTPAARRIAVLGDMYELGDWTQSAHETAGKQAAERGVDLLLALGAFSAHTAQAAQAAGLAKVMHFTDKAALCAYLLGQLRPQDAVLYKASRGVRLEEVIHCVYQGLEAK